MVIYRFLALELTLSSNANFVSVYYNERLVNLFLFVVFKKLFQNIVNLLDHRRANFQDHNSLMVSRDIVTDIAEIHINGNQNAPFRDGKCK